MRTGSAVFFPHPPKRTVTAIKRETIVLFIVPPALLIMINEVVIWIHIRRFPCLDFPYGLGIDLHTFGFLSK
ncbi:hypothetical protein C8Z91_29295 [Paenibacillus elgii]|uniref:Uncharacterized protein n=1 Tax=Paenibacillus elgii TaxID=189691 RepID=A0A2T6FV11_9BACL|nr:hypothetical protein C8Z91_29295 [Paenibacillus elgii]